MVDAAEADTELLRLHRRACTDMAARMRLPRWDQLGDPLQHPLDSYTIADLLDRVIVANLEFAADLSGQPRPGVVDAGDDPIQAVVESIRTVLTVVAGVRTEDGFSPVRREQFWTRIVELTVLGHDLQQAIRSGAGLDDLIIDRIISAGPDLTYVWPGLDPIDVTYSSPTEVLLLRSGRSLGLSLVAEDNCATGLC